MRLVALIMLAIFIPPLGIPLLLLESGRQVGAPVIRDGGVFERRAADRRVAAEPWWNDVHEVTA